MTPACPVLAIWGSFALATLKAKQNVNIQKYADTPNSKEKQIIEQFMLLCPSR
jgi:hypothetical protein